MIDLKKAKREINNYTKQYDLENDRIKVKIAHIQRVAQNSKKIAESLNLEKEDIELSELIGLLHDIGRFEQARIYNTFVDRNSVNHGELGVKILFEDRLIDKIIEDRQYDDIIKKSILNHNRNPKNVETSNERELLHSKIIRDADKIDILYILTFGKKEVAWEKADLSEETITDEIYREFIEEKSIDYSKRKTSADILVSHFAYIFDIYFKCSLKIIEENRYLEKVYNRFTFKDELTKKRIDEIYNIAVDYIDKKIK